MIISDDIKIKIDDSIITIMKKHIQWKPNDVEAGGILIGRENLYNNNIIIEYITEPMENDIRTSNRFIRKDSRHLAIYNKLYENNEGIYAYFGEWHTHFEDIPKYSLIDLINWHKIAYQDTMNVQYHIIVGRLAMTIWKINKKHIFPRLVKEIRWSEISN